MKTKKFLSIMLMLCLLVGLFVFPTSAEAATKLSAPKLKSVTLTSSTTIAVKWNKVKGAKKYVVYCSKNGGKYKKIATTTDKIYVHKNLSLKTKYTYKIKAVSGKKSSKYSNKKGVTTKDNAYMLDVVKPYESPYWFTEYNGKTFTMGGDSYTHGFTCEGYGNEGEGNVTCFNLHGDYNKISFYAGVVQRAGIFADSDDDCTIIILKDGVVADTIVINPNQLPTKHEVDISNCSQLKICVTDGRYVADGSGTYGFGELKIYK